VVDETTAPAGELAVMLVAPGKNTPGNTTGVAAGVLGKLGTIVTVAA